MQVSAVTAKSIHECPLLPPQPPPAEVSARPGVLATVTARRAPGKREERCMAPFQVPLASSQPGIQPDVAMDTFWPTATEADAQSPLVGTCIQPWHKAHARAEKWRKGTETRLAARSAEGCCTDWPRLAFIKRSSNYKNYNVKARRAVQQNKTQVL